MDNFQLSNRHPRFPSIVEQHMEMWRRMILGIDSYTAVRKTSDNWHDSILVQ